MNSSPACGNYDQAIRPATGAAPQPTCRPFTFAKAEGAFVEDCRKTVKRNGRKALQSTPAGLRP
jgi:hypothetical protein